MEVLLGKLTQHAMNYAIRSGIALTSGYAINQCSRLLKTVEGREREEIVSLQTRLESKIRIISPAINMIELIAARGNTSLDSAVALTKSLRHDIQSLGIRLAKAADQEQGQSGLRTANHAQAEAELKAIISDIKRLLNQIEDAVPFINLAITTSGVNLSTALPATVSPSRLLQASTFLSSGDSAYNMNTGQAMPIGPSFTLSLYMLFGGHSLRQDIKGAREMTWKEVIHKARVKLLRVPLDNLYDLPGAATTNKSGHADDDSFLLNFPSEGLSNEYAYQLLIIEDLDDDRVHTFDDEDLKPGPFEDVALAGIREVLPIHEVSKIFYADTGKILNIGNEAEVNNPILLIKRDLSAAPPRRMMDRLSIEGNETPPGWPPGSPPQHVDEEDDDPGAQLHQESGVHLASSTRQPSSTQAWRLPPDLDPEWMALEVYVEEPDSDEEDEAEALIDEPLSPSRPQTTREGSVDPMTSAFKNMDIRSSTPNTPQANKSSQLSRVHPASTPVPTYSSSAPQSLPPVRTSLSLLELLIRLTALQQFQQCPHLAIEDELLNFFLAESSSTGAGADSERRKMMRSSARRHVGFDPYAESPIKLRGEEYLHERQRQEQWDENSAGGYDFDSQARPSPGRFYSPDGLDESPARLRSSHSQQRSHKSGGSVKSSPPIPATGRFPAWQASSPVTPPSSRARTEALRKDGDVKKSSPLARSENQPAL